MHSVAIIIIQWMDQMTNDRKEITAVRICLKNDLT